MMQPALAQAELEKANIVVMMSVSDSRLS